MPSILSRRLALALPLSGLALAGLALPVVAPRPAAAQAPSMPPLGDPAAPVTVIEYASLTCPHCATFHTETMPEVKKRYIEPGKVKFEFRDFPLDELALRAAQLAQCAGPERYYRFLDVYFAQQESWARAADPIAALKQLSRLGGMSEEAADTCLADKALEDRILQGRLDGQAEHGVSSTPTFVVGEAKDSGALTIDQFAALVDPALN